jgi:hypothetical protein
MKPGMPSLTQGIFLFFLSQKERTLEAGTASNIFYQRIVQ